jgi:CheY-like chemotaxis protein/signal transduction histidine kinase
MKNILLAVMAGATFISGAEIENGPQDDLTMWIALFLLGIVGVVILYVGSYQVSRTRNLHSEILDRQKKMEEKQTQLLTKMSENIHDIAKNAIESRDSVLDQKNQESLEEILSMVVNEENKLLNITNDLIEFLRLKSKKVNIDNASFNLNNVLNEVSGSIGAIFQKKNVELIFDIDNNIPKLLIGDSLKLGQVLQNLLESSMEMTEEGEVKLEISRYNTFEENIELQFQIVDTGQGIGKEEQEEFFEPYYDESNAEYIGLGAFVSRELTKLMDGELVMQSIEKKGTTFTIVLPFKLPDVKNRRNYRLPEKVLTEKRVLIVDNNYNAALAAKKMFSYFRHDVKLLTKKSFVSQKPNLEEYDIIALDQSLFNSKVNSYLEKIKKQKGIRIVALRSLLSGDVNIHAEKIIDRELCKPLNQERIFELIVNLYQLDISHEETEEPEKAAAENTLPQYRHDIEETKNISRDDFSRFGHCSVLIVEDDIINQKVLTNVLEKSGMKITIANNGEIAVDQVLYRGKKFDLVLMDINMPVMDGYTATRKIRESDRFNDLPIIAFTALVLESEISKMFDSGINAFLSKPLSIGKLYTAFDRFAGGEKIKPKSIPQKEAPRVIENSIDLTEGISFSGGNEALYMEVLSEFLEAYGNSDTLFEKLVKEKRLEQTKILMLDMRGLTAAIGAKRLHQKLLDIQKLFIYGKEDQLPQMVNIYRRELSNLKVAIQNYIG